MRKETKILSYTSEIDPKPMPRKACKKHKKSEEPYTMLPPIRTLNTNPSNINQRIKLANE